MFAAQFYVDGRIADLDSFSMKNPPRELQFKSLNPRMCGPVTSAQSEIYSVIVSMPPVTVYTVLEYRNLTYRQLVVRLSDPLNGIPAASFP
jgi:hypothetical protein